MAFPKHASNLAWRALGDETVIIELSPSRFFHELNPVASFIWQLCNGNCSESEIGKAVHEEFDIDHETAKEETREFLAQLAQLHLIVWNEAPLQPTNILSK